MNKEELKQYFNEKLILCNEWLENAKDKETKIRASAVKAFIAEILLNIKEMPTIAEPEKEPTREELINHIFELSAALDSQSAGKDYVSLRRTHYKNLQWIYNNGLNDDYYKYFFSKVDGGEI